MAQAVLVVDDDAATLGLVQRLLTMAGYTVRTAQDGEDALNAIAVERPQLVMTDLRMPRLDGIELIARLRQEDPAIPIIILSAVAKRVDLPGIPFLAKPFALSELLAAVQKLLPREGMQLPRSFPDW